MRIQNWNIFLFTSSGNKQKTTVHMKDAKKFNERVKDCWPRRYGCEITVNKREWMNWWFTWFFTMLDDEITHSLFTSAAMKETNECHTDCFKRGKIYEWCFIAGNNNETTISVLYHGNNHKARTSKKVKRKQNREETEEQIQQQKAEKEELECANKQKNNQLMCTKIRNTFEDILMKQNDTFQQKLLLKVWHCSRERLSWVANAFQTTLSIHQWRNANLSEHRKWCFIANKTRRFQIQWKYIHLFFEDSKEQTNKILKPDFFFWIILCCV